MIAEVDNYLSEGCGRCPLVGTPECKVQTFSAELKELRRILLSSELTEELKWSMPCYTFNGANVVMLSAFKEFVSLNFFKGVLLKDELGLLRKQGKNVQAARILKFTEVSQVFDLELDIKAYIDEAIGLEKAGKKVEFKKELEPMPDELISIFENNPELKAAFEALTPGRQRGYILHFSQPKQSNTRTSRIEKSIPKIMEGKGFHD